jgi:hypothetical protein
MRVGSGQCGGGIGSMRAAEAAQQRRWRQRRQLGSGRQQGGRVAAATKAERWLGWQHRNCGSNTAEAAAAHLSVAAVAAAR